MIYSIDDITTTSFQYIISSSGKLDSKKKRIRVSEGKYFRGEEWTITPFKSHKFESVTLFTCSPGLDIACGWFPSFQYDCVCFVLLE